MPINRHNFLKLCVRTYIYVYANVCLCICLFLCTYICVYKDMCLCTEKELGLFLVAQIVKNQPAVPEIQVSSLGWEASLEKGLALCSQYSCQGNSIDRGASGLQSMGSQRVGRDLREREKEIPLLSPGACGQPRAPSWTTVSEDPASFLSCFYVGGSVLLPVSSNLMPREFQQGCELVRV